MECSRPVFRPNSRIKPLTVPLTQYLTADSQTHRQPLRWLAVGEGGESNFSTQAARLPQFPEHSSKLDCTRTQASALLRRRVPALRFSSFVPRLPPPCCLRPIRCKERLTRRQHPAAPPTALGGALDGARTASVTSATCNHSRWERGQSGHAARRRAPPDSPLDPPPVGAKQGTPPWAGSSLSAVAVDGLVD